MKIKAQQNMLGNTYKQRVQAAIVVSIDFVSIIDQMRSGEDGLTMSAVMSLPVRNKLTQILSIKASRFRGSSSKLWCSIAS